MRYVTPLLIGVPGWRGERVVVETLNGKLLSITPFEGEAQSMVFVCEMLIASSPLLRNIKEWRAGDATGNAVYAYSVATDGSLAKLG